MHIPVSACEHICASAYMSVCRECLYLCGYVRVRVSICMPVCLYVFMSVCLHVCATSTTSASICLYDSMFVCLSIRSCLPVCLSTCLGVCPYICMSACFNAYLYVSRHVWLHTPRSLSLRLPASSECMCVCRWISPEQAAWLFCGHRWWANANALALPAECRGSTLKPPGPLCLRRKRVREKDSQCRERKRERSIRVCMIQN